MANKKTKALPARLVSAQLFESVYIQSIHDGNLDSVANHNLHVHFLVLKHCLQKYGTIFPLPGVNWSLSPLNRKSRMSCT